MADQSYGLRFDIYERVHLAENVIGIDELEEIELYPKIQVIPGEEYASLRGHLLLSGLYRGDGETQELEHWIPVEITIPLSRVGKLEDIAVEIENFDVDLLSARSLNITGVLSLQGIETSSLAADTEEWKDREFVVAHEPVSELRGEDDEEDDAAWEGRLNPENLERSYTEHFRTWEQQSEPEPADADEHEQPAILTWNNSTSPLFAESVVADKEAGFPDVEEARDPEWPGDEEGGNQQSVIVSEINLGNLGSDAAVNERESQASVSGAEAPYSFETEVPSSADFGTAESVFSEKVEAIEEAVKENQEAAEDVENAVKGENQAEAEEKKELKIALGSKKSGDKEQDKKYGISKLLSKQRQVEPGLDPQEEEPAQAEAQQEDGDEVRWKNLFIRNAEEQNPFRKVKLVIVQREETLDEIAERYQLSTRELQLYNRLSEHHLSEGQVLYIP
ncbi:LysM peptidoglycan-binding domain-containing protein [Paenibacillus sp. M1]|uniref:LysM peptidoglycan-binding domain-containing protein n=1 Tax=Paenibacillus haidiansis TaxID=1574488 RepID=A0ABU7VXP8_9BACL